jgi:hypothetical protein
VRIKRGNATGVEAGVRGSRVYDVEIAWDGRRLSLFCDCPYYEDVGACKHIWATILAADAQNYFTAITRMKPQGHLFRRDGPMRRPTMPMATILTKIPPTTRPHRPAPVFKPQPQIAPPAWRQRLNEIVPAGSLAHRLGPRSASCSTSSTWRAAPCAAP